MGFFYIIKKLNKGIYKKDNGEIIVKIRNFVFLVFCVLIAGRLSAQNLIGKIDIRRVMLLHPAMIKYSPEHKAFKVERDEKAKRAVNQESKEAEEEIAALKSEMANIDELIRKEDNDYGEKCEALRRRYMVQIRDKEKKPGALEAAKVIYDAEASRIEGEHNLNTNVLYTRYTMAEDRLMKLTQFGFNQEYTTPTETEEKLNSILGEIKATIKKIANMKGVSVVLNTGYKRAIKESVKYNENFPISESGTLEKIFNNQIPEKLTNDSAAMIGYYSRINDSVKIWLDDADHVLNRISNDMIDSDIIMGGVDLTQEVLKSLYDKYKVNPAVGNAVIQSALSY